MIEGKVVAVTGASSGIGKAVAETLARRGAKIALGASGADRLRATAEAIRQSGAEVAYAAIDVARREDLQRLVACALDAFGRLDVIVSNAGVMPIGPFRKLTVADWERMIDVNVKGVLWGIAAALPVFEAQGSGHFIHMVSTAARKIVPGQGVYAGSKAAVLAITDGLRQELVGQIRATAIIPGFTATNSADHVSDPEVRASMAQYDANLAMPAQAVADAVAYAIDQPEGVNIGEITVRSLQQA